MTSRYRCKVKIRISFDHEIEVDTDNPYSDAVDAAKSALATDPFIVERKASLDFVSMESEIITEDKEE